MRLTMNISDDLIRRVDMYADSNYINRTSAISVLLARALQIDDVNQSIIKFGSMLDKVD